MKILFSSLNCLIDPGSGAAISVRTILGLLAEQGHEVRAFSAACFDKAQKDSAPEMLTWAGFKPADQAGWWEREDGPVRHHAYPVGTHHVAKVDPKMTEAAVDAIGALFDEFEPDIILAYGAGDFDKQVRMMARMSGVPVVFYLANPNYQKADAFAGIDHVLTDSEATAKLYKERLNLDTTVIGKFISRLDAKRPTRANRHITFVNPQYPKGVTMFYRIAEMMNEILPTARFLVVESRATLDEAEKRSGMPFSKMRNIRRIGMQSDMANVFSRTHVLLMPSLWHESGGRTAIEAMSLGIPVVSSNHGGLPEHLGDGAVRLDVPPQMQADPRLIPPASVAMPWVSTLAALWSEEDYWAERSEAALEQWKHHAPEARVAMISQTFEGLIKGK